MEGDAAQVGIRGCARAEVHGHEMDCDVCVRVGGPCAGWMAGGAGGFRSSGQVAQFGDACGSPCQLVTCAFPRVGSAVQSSKVLG